MENAVLSKIEPTYHGFYRLPPLSQRSSVIENPDTDTLALILLFSDDHRPISNALAWVKAAIYSRAAALKYTDAVREGVEVKIYAEDKLRKHIEDILVRNHVDPDTDVLWFNCPPLPMSDKWGYLGRQMSPFWDPQIKPYKRIMVWDSDFFFIEDDDSNIFRNLKKLHEKEIGYNIVHVRDWQTYKERFSSKLDERGAFGDMSMAEFLTHAGTDWTSFKFVQQPISTFWSYPPRFFQQHQKPLLRWITEFGPYFGSDELAAVCWSHKFGIRVRDLAGPLNINIYHTHTFLRITVAVPGVNALHGVFLPSDLERFKTILRL